MADPRRRRSASCLFLTSACVNAQGPAQARGPASRAVVGSPRGRHAVGGITGPRQGGCFAVGQKAHAHTDTPYAWNTIQHSP